MVLYHTDNENYGNVVEVGVFLMEGSKIDMRHDDEKESDTANNSRMTQEKNIEVNSSQADTSSSSSVC